METESERDLPFLDLDIYRRPDGCLGHEVYRKPTHTNFYLNAKSHHHPSNKQAVLNILWFPIQYIMEVFYLLSKTSGT
jgi:hypothetical protein